MRSAAAAALLAVDRLDHFAAGLADAAADMACELVRFALRPQLAVTGRTADNLLRNALHLLSNTLYFLLGGLSAEIGHLVSSLGILNKQEAFRQNGLSDRAGN